MVTFSHFEPLSYSVHLQVIKKVMETDAIVVLLEHMWRKYPKSINDGKCTIFHIPIPKSVLNICKLNFQHHWSRFGNFTWHSCELMCKQILIKGYKTHFNLCRLLLVLEQNLLSVFDNFVGLYTYVIM